MTSCEFCNIIAKDDSAKKTPWLYHDGDVAIVVDLNPKGYAQRLLIVIRQHVHCSQRKRIIQLWKHISPVVEREVKQYCQDHGFRLARWDLWSHSRQYHWHAQACLERI